MAEKKRVFVAVYAAEAAAKVGQYIAGEAGDEFEVAGMADLLDDLPEKLEEGKPDLVLLYRGLPGVTDFREMVWRLRKERPLMRIIVLEGSVSEDDPATREFRADMVAAHVHDWVTGSLPGCLLDLMRKGRTFEEVAEYARARPGFAMEIGGTVRAGVTSEGSVRTVEVQVEVPRVVDPRFFVVWGPKSAGRSALAANLAALVARRVGAAGDGGHARVVLLDLDLEGGDAGAFLGLPPEAEGLEPLARLGHLDGAAVRRHAHNRFGVDVIPAGPFPSQVLLAERFGGKAQEAESFAARLLAATQAEYPFVVVDAPAHLAQPFAYTALANAKEVLFCVRPARAGLRRAISVLDLAGTCGIDREKFRLVVNGAAPGGVGASEIAEALGLKLATVLPADLSGHLTAEMAGRPYVLAKDRFEWERLANAVFPAPRPAAGRRTGILRLIGGVLRRDRSAEG